MRFTRDSHVTCVLLAALIIGLASCGGGNTSGLPTGAAAVDTPLTALVQVPFPTSDEATPPRVASAPAANQIDGVDSYLESDNTFGQSTSRNFDADPGEIAWAIYQFPSLTDWCDLSAVGLEWNTLPVNYYVGLADFDKMQWHWLDARGSSHGGEDANDTIPWPDGLNGISPNGNCYVAVLFYDNDGGILDLASLGWQTDSNGPTTYFEVDPVKGNASLEVNFDASGTVDEDAGGISLYEWDWEGDGVFDESGPSSSTQHVYTEIGEYHPILRTTDDDDGLTDTAQLTVTVQGWYHSFGTSAGEAIFGAATQRNDVYLVGQRVQNEFSDPDYDALLIGYSADGLPLFQKTWGESTNDIFFSVAAVYGGGFVAVGQTAGFGADKTAVVVVRFDRSGNQLWARMWDTPGSERANGVSLDLAGNIWVAAISDGLHIGSSNDGIVLKYNADGDLLFEKSIVDSGETICNAIEASLGYGTFVAGSSGAYESDPVATLWNFSDDGTLSKEIALDSGYATSALDLETTPFGEVFISGTYESDHVLVAKVNSSAEFAWATGWPVGSNAAGSGIQVRYSQFLNITDVYVGGITFYAPTQTVLTYLLRLNPNGTYSASKTWLQDNGPATYAMAQGKVGTILFAGQSIKAATTRSNLDSSTLNFIGINTYAGTSVAENVSATKAVVSSASVPLDGTHDAGAGNGDAWVASFIPEDL